MSNNHYFPLKRVYSHSLPENLPPLPVIKFYCRLATAKAKMIALKKANEDFEVTPALAVDNSSDVIETDFKIAIDSFARASADAVAALAIATRAKYDANDAEISFANAKDDVDAVERLYKVKYDEILNVTDDSFAKAAAFAASVAATNAKKAAIAAKDVTIAAYKADVEAADAFAVKADIDATAAEEKLSVTNKKLYSGAKIKADVARTKAYSCAAAVTASNAKVNIAISEAAVASSAAILERLLTSVNAGEIKDQLDVANAKVVVADSKNDAAIIQSDVATNAAEKAKAVCEEAISNSVSVALLSAKADSVAADANALRRAKIVKEKAYSNSNDYIVKAEIAKAKAEAYAKAANEMKTKADDYADLARSYSAYFRNKLFGDKSMKLNNSILMTSARDNSNAIFVYEPAKGAATTKSNAFAAAASTTKAKANAYSGAALKAKAVIDVKTALEADAALAKADALVKLESIHEGAQADADYYADKTASADSIAIKTTLNAYNAYRNSNYYKVKNVSTSMILDLARASVTNAKAPIDAFEAAKFYAESTANEVVYFSAAAENAYAAVEKAKTKTDIAVAVATKTKSIVVAAKGKEDAYNALVESDTAASKVEIYANVAITKEAMDAAEAKAVYDENVYLKLIAMNFRESYNKFRTPYIIKLKNFAQESRAAFNAAKKAYDEAVAAANAVDNQTNNATNKMVYSSIKKAREVTFDISPHYIHSDLNHSSYVKQETNDINMTPAYKLGDKRQVYEIARIDQRILDMSKSNIALVKAKASAYTSWAADAAKAKAAAFAKKNNSTEDLAAYYSEADRKRRLDAESSSISRYSYQLINPRPIIPHRYKDAIVPIDEERRAEKAAEESAAKKAADDEAHKKIKVNTAETVKAKADTYRAAAKAANAKADAFAAAADAAKAKADAFANININDSILRVKAAAEAAERAVSRAKIAFNSATTAATKTKKDADSIRDLFIKSNNYLTKNSNSEYVDATNAVAAAKKYSLEMSKAATSASAVAAKAKSDLAKTKSQGDAEAYKKAKEHSVAMSKAAALACAAAYNAKINYSAKLKLEKAAAKTAKMDAKKPKAEECHTGTVVAKNSATYVSEYDYIVSVKTESTLIEDDINGETYVFKGNAYKEYYKNILNKGDRVRYTIDPQKGIGSNSTFGRRLYFKNPPLVKNIEIIKNFSFF